MFEGRVAIVTGAGAGIGRASALAFAQRGAKVVVADWVVEGGDETVQIIKQAGGEATFIKADVSKLTEVEALIDKAVETYGRLDFAHNNAGLAMRREWAPTADISEEVWDRMITLNLKSVWLCMKFEIPQMLKQGKGAIVNTSSLAGLKGLSGQAAYVASKHGVVGLTKSAAIEYATLGIRINCICPGVINTPLIAPNMKDRPHVQKGYIDMEPIGRLGKPEEIASAVLWLCSDEASFAIGSIFSVDGGVVAR